MSQFHGVPCKTKLIVHVNFQPISGPASYPLPRGPGVRHREADMRLEGRRDQLRLQDKGEEGQATPLHR